MFANLIYFIVVLLIFSTYQPSGRMNFSPIETAALFLGIILFFILIVQFLFRRIEKRIDFNNHRVIDRRFTILQSRLSVMTVIIFGVDVYALNLIDYITQIPLLGDIPTFQAIICMTLFIGYLSIVWRSSYSVYLRLYPSAVDKRDYILSNISFAVPVLLPLLVLSVLTDIIYALPFNSVKAFLFSIPGEISYTIIIVTVFYIIGPAMIQKFWRCKPLPQGPERSRIESLCRKTKVSYRNIVDWPIFGGRMITAGVMGLVKRFRYILVTRALLSYLTPEELDAVIAHEIGHVKKHHLLYYLIFFTGYMLLLSGLFWYFGPIYFLNEFFSFLSSITLVASFLIYFRYIFGYFMRNFERQADAYAFSMFGTASPLVSTFQKIAYTSGQAPDKPNWHHFSLNQRIDFLQRCEANPKIVLHHDRKVFRSVLIFFVALIFLGLTAFQLSFGKTGQQFRLFLGQKVYQHSIDHINHEIEKDPTNIQLLTILGDIYYSKNDFEKTINAYEQALYVDPDLSNVLNNLAWLYVTCEDKRFRNPERGLLLAEKAATLEPTPETLDTLAESYYINRYYEKAIETGNKALTMAGTKRSYYEDQLKKFMAAANGPASD